MNRASYQHGDLRRVLIETTSDVIASDGTGGFSLCKIARLAGVSASAPAHHFGDSKGLLTAVAAEGFRLLVGAFESIDQRLDPHERLVTHGRADVSLGIDYPGYMAVMFRSDLLDTEDGTYRRDAPRSYELISTAATEAIANVGAALDLKSPPTGVHPPLLRSLTSCDSLALIERGTDEAQRSRGLVLC